jgi:hypothetical protein
MNQVSRRRFLVHGSIGAALAGALVALPGVGAALKLASAARGGARASAAQPLIAHVRDLSTGEISLMVGERHVIQRDAELAARLYDAAQQES